MDVVVGLPSGEGLLGELGAAAYAAEILKTEEMITASTSIDKSRFTIYKKKYN